MTMVAFNCLFCRRWHTLLYAFVIFIFFLYVIEYSPGYRILRRIRWTETKLTSVDTIPCYPKKNIVFLKTHKCASSSIQNILFRYADRRNLTVVVPPKTGSFSLLKKFDEKMIAGAPWETLGYNILVNHMVFNKQAVTKIMPKDSIYVTILRSPVSLFESLYEYDDLESFYNMDIEAYARATKNITFLSKLQKRTSGMGRNQMLYDFGIHPKYFDDYKTIQEAIMIIEDKFDFIMIAENFDESIILLKHILCWELDDVVSLSINARMASFRKNLSEEAFHNILQWNWGDKLLYDHFYKKFQETVDEFGKEQMAFEVDELKKRRKTWFDYCIEKKIAATNLTSYKIWSNKVSAYVVKDGIENKTCEDMVKPENFFTREIRQHQLLRSIEAGAKIPINGPMSLRKLIDLKVLKGKDLEFAKTLLKNQYKYRRRRLSPRKNIQEKQIMNK